MGIFSRGRSADDNDDFAAAPTADQPPPALSMPDINDHDAMRRYIAERYIVESQMAESPATRVAALKALSDLVLVSEETKYKITQRVKDPVANIVIVQQALTNAKRLALSDH